jgi:hypothetical protein
MFTKLNSKGDSEVSKLIKARQFETLVARLWEEDLMQVILDKTADGNITEGKRTLIRPLFLWTIGYYVGIQTDIDPKVSSRIQKAISDAWYDDNSGRVSIGNPNAHRKPAWIANA